MVDGISTIMAAVDSLSNIPCLWENIWGAPAEAKYGTAVILRGWP